MKPKITVFHCINSLLDAYAAFADDAFDCEIHSIRLPCSGLVKDVYLLRAFESGSDAVVVLVCPDGACRHIEGNKRAHKRVAWTKQLLQEIGIDERRLCIAAVASGDTAAAADIIKTVLAGLDNRVPLLSEAPAHA